MTARYGIDSSILVRLVTGDPEDGFEHCVRKRSMRLHVSDSPAVDPNEVKEQGARYVIIDK